MDYVRPEKRIQRALDWISDNPSPSAEDIEDYKDETEIPILDGDEQDITVEKILELIKWGLGK